MVNLLQRRLVILSSLSSKYKNSGHPSKSDFVEFGHRNGVDSGRIEKLLQPFLVKPALLETLVGRSFLKNENKRAYLLMYHTRRNFLNK